MRSKGADIVSFLRNFWGPRAPARMAMCIVCVLVCGALESTHCAAQQQQHNTIRETTFECAHSSAADNHG